VSVAELQDPLLSAGIFLTREQVYRVMLNADKIDTAGLDFEELLNALYSTSGNVQATRLLGRKLLLQEAAQETTGGATA